MKDGKKHGLFWVFKTILTFLLIIYTCVRCCMIVSVKHHANALETGEFIDLSPAQTLALYGTQIQALLVTQYNQPAQSITFDYAFPLNSVGYMDEGGGFSRSQVYGALSIGSDAGRNEVSDYMANTNGLVYIASASQWGGTKVQGYNKYGSNPVQLHCPFSISLSGIGGIQQGIQYSTYSHFVSTNNLSYASDNEAIYISSPSISVNSLPGSTYANVIRTALFSLPSYPYFEYTYDNDMQVFNPLDSSQQLWMAGFYVNTEEQLEPFDIRGITIDCYGVTSAQTNSNDLWIVVQCPRIWSYTPPVITTTRPAETIPAATYPVETMPPAYTDTPQNILNQNLITNNYQLNLIIGQLNLIYNQLKINGELSARLAAALDADNDPGLQFPVNTDIRQYMSDAFYQTGTEFVYSPEDLQSYTRAIPWLSSMLYGQTWFIPFAFLGTIGLLMIVFSYIVFRR